jgi:Toprim-like
LEVYLARVSPRETGSPLAADVRGFFAAIGVELPAGGDNVSVQCFADPEAHRNGDRTPSTSVNTGSGAWICFGCGAAGGPYQAARAVGLPEGKAGALLGTHGLKSPVPAASALETSEADLIGYQERLLANSDLLSDLASRRGWTLDTLEQLGVGFDGERITLPVRNEEGALVGVARYLPGERGEAPKMIADTGSKRQLFPGPEAVDERDGYLLLVEGEPDAIAAHSFGLAAVAIPGANNWQTEWKQRFAGRKVAIVLDSDEVGRKATVHVAADLAPVAAEVRLTDLDPKRHDGYDLTDYLMLLHREQVPDAKGLVQLRAERGRLVEPERGQDVLDATARFLRRYVVLGEAELTAAALWVVHTHTFDAAEATPYLAINSAEKESGKTRLLETLELLVAKPWLTGRVTTAVLTRKVDREEPTLLLDESDAAFGGEKEYAEVLRGVLNTGYRRGGKTSVAVPAGRDWDYRDLATFCPKAIAGIGKLPDTVQSRSISITLKRKAAAEQVQRFRRKNVEAEAAPLRQRRGCPVRRGISRRRSRFDGQAVRTIAAPLVAV